MWKSGMIGCLANISTAGLGLMEIKKSSLCLVVSQKAATNMYIKYSLSTLSIC